MYWVWILIMILGIIGSYIATSLFFFKFPNLIQRKNPLKFTCVHISHRGGAGENPENTLAAFEHWIALLEPIHSALVKSVLYHKRHLYEM